MTSDLRYFRKGIQVPAWQTARWSVFRKLKSSYDHARFVVVPDLYLGGGAPVRFKPEVKAKLIEKTDLAMASGLRVDWCINPWRQEVNAMYTDPGMDRFDVIYQEMAELANSCDLTRLRAEILPEPGWTSLEDGGFTDRLKDASLALEEFWLRNVPMIQSQTKLTLLLGTPGYGHYVPNESVYLTASYENTVHTFRSYWPFPFTHAGLGRMWYPYTWPQPDPYSIVDVVAKFESGGLSWDEAGMRAALQNVLAFGRRVHFSEAGCPKPMGDTEAGIAYWQMFTRLCTELSLSWTKWGQ